MALEDEIQRGREIFWGERVRERLEELLELIEMDFFGIGDRYGAEQFLENPEAWNYMGAENKKILLRALEDYLKIDLEDSSKVVRTYREEGVAGAPSEGGAEVDVFETRLPQLEVHVMKYRNPQLGTRYNLMRTS